MWWFTPIIPVPGKLRQGDCCEFETVAHKLSACLVYMSPRFNHAEKGSGRMLPQALTVEAGEVGFVHFGK